jgi:hypothetical protein
MIGTKGLKCPSIGAVTTIILLMLADFIKVITFLITNNQGFNSYGYKYQLIKMTTC